MEPFARSVIRFDVYKSLVDRLLAELVMTPSASIKDALRARENMRLQLTKSSYTMFAPKECHVF